MKLSLLSTEESALVEEWAIKYLSLTNLIMNLVVKHLQPSVDDNVFYISNRMWFKQNEEKILALSRLHDNWWDIQIHKHGGPEESACPHLDNPFDDLYEPEDIGKFFELRVNHYLSFDVITDLEIKGLSIHLFYQWACEDDLCFKSHWRERVRVGKYNVLASSFAGLIYNKSHSNLYLKPDSAFYLADVWHTEEPCYPTTLVNWLSDGVVSPDVLSGTVESIIGLLKSGNLVEIGCFDGHGRTGTLIAYLFVRLENLNPSDAIKTVRERYCDLAIKTPEQENLVAEFYKLSERCSKNLLLRP